MVSVRYSNEVFGARGTEVEIVRPGDKILVGKKALRYVEIVTLQIKDAAVNQITIDKDFEFGVRLAANTSEGSEIYIWK